MPSACHSAPFCTFLSVVFMTLPTFVWPAVARGESLSLRKRQLGKPRELAFYFAESVPFPPLVPESDSPLFQAKLRALA